MLLQTIMVFLVRDNQSFSTGYKSLSDKCLCLIEKRRKTFSCIPYFLGVPFRFTTDADDIIARLEDEKTPDEDGHDKQVRNAQVVLNIIRPDFIN